MTYHACCQAIADLEAKNTATRDEYVSLEDSIHYAEMRIARGEESDTDDALIDACRLKQTRLPWFFSADHEKYLYCPQSRSEFDLYNAALIAIKDELDRLIRDPQYDSSRDALPDSPVRRLRDLRERYEASELQFVKRQTDEVALMSADPQP